MIELGTAMLEAVVLIVSYNGRRYLDECLASVLASDDGPLRRHVLVVDNASSDGTAAYLAQSWPQVHCVGSTENLGFAGGNNLGWEEIQRSYPNAKYVALLNQDTVVASGWLKALIEFLEEHPNVGIAQSKLMLHQQPDCFNTVGNVSHFLGFGFTTACGDRDQGQYDEPRPIDFPSGAAFAIAAEQLRRWGLFDGSYFLYLEDADIGWKLRQLGLLNMYVPSSVVYHKYEFKADYRNYYFLERNRWWLLLVYYKLPTLLLLAPALIAMECGQLLFAAQHGILRQKLRAYGYYLSFPVARRLVQARREAQRRRRIGDREFLRSFTGRIQFVGLQSFLVRYIANPGFGAYWAVVRNLIWW
jgi:GT2 family glycosyltransferase